MATKPHAADAAKQQSENPAEDSRRGDLDRFAEATARPIQMAPSVRDLPAAGDRVFGAQPVAVYRDDARVLQKISALAAAAGSDWGYRFPVRNKKTGQTDWIEGPSIKLANDVARIYGNCDIDVRVVDLGDSWLFYARLTDFESGFALTRPFQQRKSQSSMGGGDNARTLDIAFQIGASKAIRNVITNGLQTFADFGFEESKKSLVTKIGADLARWRSRTLEGLAKIPVPIVNAEKVIGRASKDWLAPDVALVIAMMKAIADGMATVEETFPAPDKQVEGAAEGDKPIDSFAQSKQSEAAASPDAAAPVPPVGAAAPAGGGSPAAPESEQSPKAVMTSGAAAATTEQPKPEQKPVQAVPPTNEREYVAWADAWREVLTDAAVGVKQWSAEKTMRNHCNVPGEIRDTLKEKLEAKIAALQGK